MQDKIISIWSALLSNLSTSFIKTHISTYKSVLGEIDLTVTSKKYRFELSKVKTGKVNDIILKYKHGIIKISEFKLPTSTDRNDKIGNSIGWSILIESNDNNIDVFLFECRFNEELKGFMSTGENLDGLQFTINNTYDLHIGTEDADSIMWRAKIENFMPKRFYELLKNKDFDYAIKHFTDYCDNGFQSRFPKLLKNEILKFHYLIAEKEIFSENDVRTWLAVEKSIEEVDRIIKSEKVG